MDKWEKLKSLLQENIKRLEDEFEMDRVRALYGVLEDMENLEREEDSK